MGKDVAEGEQTEGEAVTDGNTIYIISMRWLWSAGVHTAR